MVDGKDRQPRQTESQRWGAIRDLGVAAIVGITAIATTSSFLLRTGTENSAPAPVVVASASPPASAPTPPPSPPAIVVLPPGGATLGQSSTEAYSVTIGHSDGMTSVTTHHLGGGYQYAMEFLQLLKQRDPKLYAWEKAQMANGIGGVLAQPPGSKQVGETEYGLPIYEGQTLVVPLRQRSPAEIEADYRVRYEWTHGAYVMEQARKQAGERAQRLIAEQAKAKGIPLKEYKAMVAQKSAHASKTGAELVKELREQAAAARAGVK